MTMKTRFLAVMVLALAVSFSGCLCARGTVNSSDSLRWWLFSNFGANQICPEMVKHGVPLKLGLLGPSAIGRYFPAQCGVRVNDQARTITVDVTGAGYAVLPVTRRVGFYAGLSVEYAMDFRLESDATYVWGRYQRLAAAPDLRLLGVENAVVNLATQTPAGDLATLLGRGILEGELSKGFTVVQTDGNNEFELAHLDPPQRPKRAFASSSKDRVVLLSDQSELRGSTRDYLGPIEVTRNDAAVMVRLHVTGPQVDFLLVDKGVGDAWLQPYEAARPIAAPPGPTIAVGQAPAGDTVRTYPLPAGLYYLVIENRAPAPASALGVTLPFEQVATVSYSIEMGDR